MARVSDEFCFDPIDRGLALRSVNSSRSAYAYVFFSSMFFQHYCCTAAPQPCQKEKQLSLACKLIIKSVLPIFRCVNVLERHVEKCSIYTNAKDHHITFQLLCRNGIVKTHNLAFQECDPLQAVFAKHMCPNVLRAHSRLLTDVMVHFPTSQEEVTLSVTPTRACFKSYTEEDTDFSKTMVTEIQLSPDEFDYFQVGVDSEVTFCLRELRGLLAFSEATSVPVSIHLDMPGNSKPLVDKCFDKDGSAEAVASKKPRWNGQAQNTGSGAPASPLAKQVKSVPPVSYRGTAGTGGTAVTKTDDQAVLEAESPYHKFHSLFFGAVSSKEKDAVSHAFHSLATASDTEEDFGKTQSSQVLQ
ncbi:cell cycle checkpoint control protein RAD9B isoform X2 [Centrocercus urophasianus]|uniref:cell cycle checkpoint control protein RAD9B isoform X2 n=1 Tax=Centrocercus urophasianus TaxID=9002 RepID=UPI001C6479D6|nr:cell cycle checkpoint control protein RAD9B isoform X2 [Centrocercus urophasianus]